MLKGVSSIAINFFLTNKNISLDSNRFNSKNDSEKINEETVLLNINKNNVIKSKDLIYKINLELLKDDFNTFIKED